MVVELVQAQQTQLIRGVTESRFAPWWGQATTPHSSLRNEVLKRKRSGKGSVTDFGVQTLGGQSRIKAAVALGYW